MRISKAKMFGVGLIASLICHAPISAACIMIQEYEPLTELIKIQKDYETELKLKSLKSKVEAAVWGVFIPQDTNKNAYPQTYSFIVGERLKGLVPGKIEIVLSGINAPRADEIYYINLRKLPDGRWTDEGVTQTRLNWDEYACDINPKSSRCAVFTQKQAHTELFCHQQTHSIIWSCASMNALPSVCLPYLHGFRQ